ncbi:MAG TPA: hypothetical protein VFD92_18000 [Candidatus Binatia bacterium]|nr:hypothetical protein [Candidatus Binatia bacterium]
MTFLDIWAANHSHVLGGLVIAVTSYTRFNTPPTSRSSTTWARYHCVAALYTVALLFTWLLFSTPDVIAALAQHASVKDLERLDLPIYAAVVMTVVVGLPPFAAIDARVRARLQELARIPWEAQRLSAALRARTWLPDDRSQEDIRLALKEAGVDEADVSFSSERTPQALWTRITALQRYIGTWQTRRGLFSGFYFANAAEIADLRAEYERLEERTRSVFPIARAARRNATAVGPGNLEYEVVAGLLGHLERLQKGLCDLVSRGILSCGRTSRSRRDEFEAIGFMVNVTPSRLFDNLVGLYLVLIAIYVVVLKMAGRPSPGPTGISIATTYAVAIVIALLMKRTTWATALPVTNYAVAALAAFAFGCLSSFALNVLTTLDVPQAWQALNSRLWPWGIMSAGIATVVGWTSERDDRVSLRRWEALEAAAACAVLAVPVVWLLHDACRGAACIPPPYWRVVTTAAVTGGLIGYFVPTWYRSPEVMTTEYAGWRLMVSVTRSEDSVLAVVDAIGPRAAGASRVARRLSLSPVEEPCTDDAIAEAVRRARTWIDRSRGRPAAPTSPADAPPLAAVG